MGYDVSIISLTGSIKISALDLAKYMTMHMNYGKLDGVRIMKKKNSKLMQTVVDLDEQYAMALRIKNDIILGVILIGHTGSKYGLLSTMFFQPKKKYGFLVITNGYIDCRGKLLIEVARKAYKEFIE